MLDIVLWTSGVLVLLLVADRSLLRMERNGWINYRRRGLSRGGAAYHALVLQSIFSPGAEHLSQVVYEQEVQRDDSGDPPGDDPDDETFEVQPGSEQAT